MYFFVFTVITYYVALQEWNRVDSEEREISFLYSGNMFIFNTVVRPYDSAMDIYLNFDYCILPNFGSPVLDFSDPGYEGSTFLRIVSICLPDGTTSYQIILEYLIGILIFCCKT